MFSVKDKEKCVKLMTELKSVILVQRAFRREFGRDPPHKNNITRWFKQFKETGSVQKRKSTGRPSVSDETVELIRQSAIRSPGKSIPRRSVELGIPKTTIHKVLHKKLKFIKKMEERFIVRLAEKKDCNGIYNLLKELADFEKLGHLMKITEEDLIKNGFERNPPLYECIVAQDNKGVLIGYALYFDTFSTWNGHSLCLEDIMVTDAWRGKGVGGKLFDTVVARADARGCGRVDFCVLNWNPAKEFYARRGCENMTQTQEWQMFRLKKDEMRKIAEKTPLEGALAISKE